MAISQRNQVRPEQSNVTLCCEKEEWETALPCCEGTYNAALCDLHEVGLLSNRLIVFLLLCLYLFFSYTIYLLCLL